MIRPDSLEGVIAYTGRSVSSLDNRDYRSKESLIAMRTLTGKQLEGCGEMMEEPSYEVQDVDFHGFLTRDGIIEKVARRELGLLAQVKDSRADVPFASIGQDEEFSLLLPKTQFDLSKGWTQVGGIFCAGRDRKRVADLSNLIRQREDISEVNLVFPAVLDSPTIVSGLPLYMLGPGLFYFIFGEAGLAAAPGGGFHFYAGGINYAEQPQAFAFQVKKLEVTDAVKASLSFDLPPGRHEMRRIRLDCAYLSGQMEGRVRGRVDQVRELVRNAAGMLVTVPGQIAGARRPHRCCAEHGRLT